MIDQSVGNYDHEFNSLCILGRVYSQAGKVDDAIACYEEQIHIARRMDSVKKEIHALNHLADINEKAGKQQRSIKYHERSLEISRFSDDSHDEGEANRDYGHMLARAGDFSQAVKFAEAAQNVFGRIGDMSCAMMMAKLIEHFLNGKSFELEKIESNKQYWITE